VSGGDKGLRLFLFNLEESSMTKCALYARCSTADQHPENQVQALREFADRQGHEITLEYIDKGISGTKRDRESLSKLLADAKARKFTVLYVVSIDRLSRSVKDLLETVELLNDLGITLIFQRENIDTKSSLGQFFLTVLGSIAALEREIMVSRIRQGIDRAKSQGKKMGRPTKMNDSLRSAVKLLYTNGATVRTIAKTCSVGIGTTYKIIQEIRDEEMAIAA
jgi:DNA invertase Pin-like site-specific DNA recombinase